jgi:signal peptide peptidase-like protein 2B
VLLIHRGNCTLYEKIINAQLKGAVAVIIISNSSSTFEIGFSNVSESKQILIPVFMVTLNDGLEILLGRNVSLIYYYAPNIPFMDSNMIITWCIAVGLVIFGSIWANYDCFEARKGEETSMDEEEESVEISMKMVIFYIVGACTMILVLYFFYKYLVYVIIVMFCLGAASGIFSVLSHVGRCLPSGLLYPNVKYIGNISVKYIIYTILSLGIPIIWFIVRHEQYGWILQDILGIVLIMTVFKTVKFPSIKISTALLTLFFIYDVFFVFITPYFTSNGESIMVNVATGGSGGDENSGPVETIPLTFVVPRLMNPFSICGEAFSILGYGDIVLPGLLVSFCLRFDNEHKESKRKIYFISSSIGYAVGLIITFIALAILRKGQPALLYLVPCTLGTVLILSKIRGDFKTIWDGFSKPTKKIVNEEDDDGKLINGNMGV